MVYVHDLHLGLQTQSNTNPLYNGPWDAIKKIYGQRGIAGIYKGQAVTLLREASGYGIYFLTYEKLVQREMRQKNIRRDQISLLNAVGYGAAAGYAVCFHATPFVSELELTVRICSYGLLYTQST